VASRKQRGDAVEQPLLVGDVDRLMLFAPDNRLGPTGECAFPNAIVRLVLDYVQSSPRLDEDGKVRQKYGDVGRPLNITRKFASKHAEQLIEKGLGYNRRPRDHKAKTRFSALSRRLARGSERVVRAGGAELVYCLSFNNDI